MIIFVEGPAVTVLAHNLPQIPHTFEKTPTAADKISHASVSDNLLSLVFKS